MPVKIWRQHTVVDRRGSPQLVADMDSPPYELRAAIVPLRGTRAEVPGQQHIKIYTMITTDELPDVGIWSRVLWQGRYYDVAAPPRYHHGTRRTRHWSTDIRERPTVEDV